MSQDRLRIEIDAIIDEWSNSSDEGLFPGNENCQKFINKSQVKRTKLARGLNSETLYEMLFDDDPPQNI